MEKISGIVILTGTCWAFSSARWRRLTRISRGLDAQHLGDRDAERVGLHHRADEGMELRDLAALAHRAQRVGAAGADLHLPQHPGELVGERSLGVGGDLLDGGVEAEAALDADGHQVDRVGQLALHLCRAVVRHLVEVQVGRQEADGEARRRSRYRDRDAGCRAAAVTAKPTTRPRTAPSTLQAMTRSTVQPAGVAREVELPADPVGRVGAGEPLADPERPALHRLEHPLGERPVEVLRSARPEPTTSPRARPATGSCPAGCGLPIAMPTSTSAASTSSTPMMKSIVMSHLHLHQTAHPEHADAQDQAAPASISQPTGSVNIGIT